MCSYLASGICAMCCARTSNITTAPGHISRWAKTHRSRGLSRRSVAFFRCRSSADCTIVTSGSDFRRRQAAIGRQFSYALLASLVRQREGELASALDRLIAAGLLFRQGAPPHATYLFKHALVQDTAYSTLLPSDRQQLHARIAEVVERRFPERITREPELLAHHLTEAHEIERAIGYWLKAGERAAERSANLEAIRHLTRGLEALKTLPESP